MSKKITLASAYGAVLRDRRIRAGVSQERLALDSGLDRTFISLLERGLRQPSLRTIFALAANLGISPDSMVAETGRKVGK
jgi:transcriptional regulator with XRE-family HTH domain